MRHAKTVDIEELVGGSMDVTDKLMEDDRFQFLIASLYSNPHRHKLEMQMFANAESKLLFFAKQMRDRNIPLNRAFLATTEVNDVRFPTLNFTVASDNLSDLEKIYHLMKRDVPDVIIPHDRLTVDKYEVNIALESSAKRHSSPYVDYSDLVKK